MQQFLVFGSGFVIAWMPHTLHLSLRRPIHVHRKCCSRWRQPNYMTHQPKITIDQPNDRTAFQLSMQRETKKQSMKMHFLIDFYRATSRILIPRSQFSIGGCHLTWPNGTFHKSKNCFTIAHFHRFFFISKLNINYVLLNFFFIRANLEVETSVLEVSDILKPAQDLFLCILFEVIAYFQRLSLFVKTIYQLKVKE